MAPRSRRRERIQERERRDRDGDRDGGSGGPGDVAEVWGSVTEIISVNKLRTTTRLLDGGGVPAAVAPLAAAVVQSGFEFWFHLDSVQVKTGPVDDSVNCRVKLGQSRLAEVSVQSRVWVGFDSSDSS